MLSAGRIETTRWIQTGNNMKRCGLDTAEEHRLLDHQCIYEMESL